MIRLAGLAFLAAVWLAGPALAESKSEPKGLPPAPNDVGLPMGTVPPQSKVTPAKTPKGQQPKGAVVGFASVVAGGQIDLDGKVVTLFDVALPKSSWPCVEWQGTKQVNADCAAQGEAVLASLVEGKTVACVLRQGDAANCYVDGRDVAEELVASGWAASCQISGRYGDAQLTAQRMRKGIWLGSGATPTADFCKP